MILDHSYCQTWTSSEKLWRLQELQLLTLLWSSRAKMWVIPWKLDSCIKYTVNAESEYETLTSETNFCHLFFLTGQKLHQKSAKSAKKGFAHYFLQSKLQWYVNISVLQFTQGLVHLTADLDLYVCIPAVCVLEKMLLLDPERRVSASEALDLPFFSEFRDAEEETEALPYDQTMDNTDLPLDQWKRKRETGRQFTLLYQQLRPHIAWKMSLIVTTPNFAVPLSSMECFSLFQLIVLVKIQVWFRLTALTCLAFSRSYCL